MTAACVSVRLKRRGTFASSFMRSLIIPYCRGWRKNLHSQTHKELGRQMCVFRVNTY